MSYSHTQREGLETSISPDLVKQLIESHMQAWGFTHKNEDVSRRMEIDLPNTPIRIKYVPLKVVEIEEEGEVCKVKNGSTKKT